MKKTKVVAKKKSSAKRPAARPARKAAPVLALVPSADAQTKRLAVRAGDLVEQTNALTIQDNITLRAGEELLKLITVEAHEVEQRRTFFVKPLKEHTKAIDAFFKTMLSPLEAAAEETRRKVKVYRDAAAAEEARAKAERDASARKEAERAAELRAAGDAISAAQADAKALEIATTAVESRLAGMAPTDGVGTRKVWKFEITAPELVPDEYRIIDERLVRRAVMSGARDIPGVRIFEDEVLVVSKAPSFEEGAAVFERSLN